jgi:hypothetical protein
MLNVLKALKALKEREKVGVMGFKYTSAQPCSAAMARMITLRF